MAYFLPRVRKQIAHGAKIFSPAYQKMIVEGLRQEINRTVHRETAKE